MQFGTQYIRVSLGKLSSTCRMALLIHPSFEDFHKPFSINLSVNIVSNTQILPCFIIPLSLTFSAEKILRCMRLRRKEIVWELLFTRVVYVVVQTDDMLFILIRTDCN